MTIEYHGLIINFDSGQFSPLYEPEEVALVKEYVRPRDKVLVGGGGEGLLAAAAVHMTGGKVSVYEANRFLADMISSNVKPSRGQIDVYP